MTGRRGSYHSAAPDTNARIPDGHEYPLVARVLPAANGCFGAAPLGSSEQLRPHPTVLVVILKRVSYCVLLR